MSAPRRSSRALPALIALVATVVMGTAGIAVAAQGRPAVVAAAPRGVGSVQAATAVPVQPAEATPAALPDLRRERRETPPFIAKDTASWATRPKTHLPTAKAQVAPKGSSGGGTTSGASLTGRNRVWMPALGIKRSVSFFSCSSKAYPGNRVYRWGCAGRNNVYLFGHAHSVFKPLHDAYVRGRLKKGMKVLYADAKGRVSTYKVIWWRVTTPDKGGFAYAGQSRPSMTLQTCVGARSQYRLIVRLVRV